MSILMFIPLTLIAAAAERPAKPRRREAYRKRTTRTFRDGRHFEWLDNA